MENLLKKSVALLVLLLPFCVNAARQSVTEDVARKVAVHFMERTNSLSAQIKDVVAATQNGLTTMYVCNFQGGGWTIVSANYALDPILAYSYEGEFHIEMNEGEENIMFDKLKSTCMMLDSLGVERVSDKWAPLMNEAGTSLRGYVVAERVNLLSDEMRGTVHWGQELRDYCPPSEKGDGNCAHAFAGCGPIAIGQLFWKWQWPPYVHYVDKNNVSYEKEIDWSLLPASPKQGTREWDETCKFIADCGRSFRVTYGCKGTSTPTGGSGYENLAMNSWGYNNLSIMDVSRGVWCTTDTYESITNLSLWDDLFVTEIRCGRPVLAFGRRSDDLNVAHMYVVSGYQYVDEDVYFYVNFGFTGQNDGYYKFFNNEFGHDVESPMKLDEETNIPYQNREIPYLMEHIIVGINPYVRSFCEDDTVLAEGKTFDKRSAMSVILPCGEKFVAKPQSNVSLKAKNEIIFRPGFVAERGAHVTATIDSKNVRESEDMDIFARVASVDEITGKIAVYVENANSYIYDDLSMREPFGAGVISEDGIVVMDYACGTSSYRRLFEIYLLNDKGVIKKIEGGFSTNTYTIANYQSFRLYKYSKDTLTIDPSYLDYVKSEDVEETHSLLIVYPNPTTGTFTASLDTDNTYTITISDMQGNLILTREGSGDVEIDLSAYGKGLYIVKAVSDSETMVEKVLLK